MNLVNEVYGDLRISGGVKDHSLKSCVSDWLSGFPGSWLAEFSDDVFVLLILP